MMAIHVMKSVFLVMKKVWVDFGDFGDVPRENGLTGKLG